MSGIYWLASYPKSGNTWFRTFLHNLRNDSERPADINDLDSDPIASARSWLDEVLGFDTAELAADEVERLRPMVYRWAAQAAEPGYHKTHDAYTLTGEGLPLMGGAAVRGAVYLLRNPLDVAPSAAHHWNCSIDEAIDRMADPQTALSRATRRLYTQVRQRLLSWSGHVRSWTEAPGLELLVLRYEDLLTEPEVHFGTAARFLRLPDDPARIARAVRHSRFEELSRQEADGHFRERPAKTARFFRSGRSGSWRDTLSAAQVRRIVQDHGALMQRHGYLDAQGQPLPQDPAG